MATRHTNKCWISKVRDVAVYAMAITLGFSSLATAGLNVSKADVEVAKKAQAQTAQRVEELEKQLADLELQAQKASARAKAAKDELDEVEKSLTTSKADIDKRTQEQPAFEKASTDADAYLQKIQQDVQELEQKQKALEEQIEENSSSIVVPNLMIVPCADDDDDEAAKEAEEAAKKKAEEEAEAAKEKAEEEAKAKEEDMKEPGFWRKRALKKGEEPKTTGEKNWLAAWKKEQADEAAKEKAEAEAKAAAEKAEAEAKAAEEKAEAEAEAKAKEEAAKKKAEEEAAKAAAEKAEAEAKAAAEKAEAEAKAAAEKAEAEERAKREAEEAKAKDLEEPGFFRKRALKKGEPPMTTGEKNWLAAYKQELADAAAAKVAAEKAAEEAKAKEEAAKVAAEKAEAEALAAAEKAEAEAKAREEAEAAKAKDLEEPGFWRQRALKKGEQPETTGERKWLEAWKAEQEDQRKAEEARLAAERAAEEAKIADEKAREEARAKREKEEAEARAKREKEEAEAKAKEDAERQAREAEELKAKLNEPPGFWRQRALKQGEKPETPGEEKWLAAWKLEQEALAKTEAEKERKEREAEEARLKAEEQRKKAEELAEAEKERERLEREKMERLARENEEPGYFRQRALKGGATPETAGERKWFAEWQAGEKSRLESELKDKQERERLVRIARTELNKVNESLITKRNELTVAENSAKSKREALNLNVEELERSKKLYERATEKIAAARETHQTAQQIAESSAAQLTSVQAELKTLKAELANRQEKINQLMETARKGQDLYIAAEAARNRYLTARGRTEGLQSKLEEYTRLASENKNRIPDVKAAVEEATAVVVDAREAYEAYRKKLYNDTKGAEKIETEIIIIEANKKNKSREERELEPLAVEVAKAVNALRAAEKVAVQVYHDADFYEFSKRKTERAIERNKDNLVRYKNEYDQALKDLTPYGSLDPLPPKVEEVQ